MDQNQILSYSDNQPTVGKEKSPERDANHSVTYLVAYNYPSFSMALSNNNIPQTNISL